MEGGMAKEGILNALRKSKHKMKKSKTPSPKRGSNILKGKYGGVDVPTTHIGVGKPKTRTATDTAPNPRPRQAEGKPAAAKKTQGDKPEKKQQVVTPLMTLVRTLAVLRLQSRVRLVGNQGNRNVRTTLQSTSKQNNATLEVETIRVYGNTWPNRLNSKERISETFT
jgi:hypothetical protein